jgi:hypothetical protein
MFTFTVGEDAEPSTVTVDWAVAFGSALSGLPQDRSNVYVPGLGAVKVCVPLGAFGPHTSLAVSTPPLPVQLIALVDDQLTVKS